MNLRDLYRTIWVVFTKELRDALRDRRTLLTVLISTVVIGPACLALITHFVAGLEEKATVRRIDVVGLEHAPELANFLARNDFETVVPSPDFRARIRAGTLREAVIVIPDDFSRALKEGRTPHVDVVVDESRNEAQPSARRAEAVIESFNRERTLLSTLARGVAPSVLRPVAIERENTATPQQEGAFLLFLIPVLALLSAVVGGMSAAIDTTAGERERGSLEPLLMNPVALGGIVLGKWKAVALQTSVLSLLTLASFALSTRLLPAHELHTLVQFGPVEVLYFALLVLPFGWMVSALQMMVASYGRSFKEAQTYASYIALIVNFVPLITLFSGLREASWQRYVPALAQQVMMARVLRGDPVGSADLLIPFGVAVLVALACLALLKRLLEDERIVFGR